MLGDREGLTGLGVPHPGRPSVQLTLTDLEMR